MNTLTFDTQAYKRQMQTFPEISYEAYQQITDEAVRKDIAQKNKILQTDTYNRTMTHIKGDEKAKQQETFTFSMRKAPNERYIVVDGIRTALKKMLSCPITQGELDFAKDFYADQAKKGGNSYFNAQMRQEVVDRGGYLPLTIFAVKDGTALKAKEPAMVVTGPSELAAIFEPDLIRPFYKSKVATDAHQLEEVMQDGNATFATKVCEQGKRAAVNEESHLDAIASLIVGGGLKYTSNDAAALVYPQVLTGGTTAHRFYASYPSEDEAMRAAVEKMDKVTLLADFVDTHSGVQKIFGFKEEYMNEKIVMPRLDSGDIPNLAVETLQTQKKRGMLDPQRDTITISEKLSSIEEVEILEKKVKKADFSTELLKYGMGGLLVSEDKTRNSVSADIGKETIPGILNIEIRNGVRYLVQEEEEVRGERLLQKVYENGTLFYGDNDIAAIDEARQQLLHTLPLTELPTKESETTQRMHQEVRKNLLSNLVKAPYEVEIPCREELYEMAI